MKRGTSTTRAARSVGQVVCRGRGRRGGQRPAAPLRACSPMRPDATPDAQFGLREFNVGTGGESIAVPTAVHSPLEPGPGGRLRGPQADAQRRRVQLGVRPDRGGDIYRRGSGSCTGSRAADRHPTRRRPRISGGPYAADANVTFNGTGSSDSRQQSAPDVRWTSRRDHGSGVSPTKTYATNGTYRRRSCHGRPRACERACSHECHDRQRRARGERGGRRDPGVAPHSSSARASPTGRRRDAPWGWTIT